MNPYGEHLEGRSAIGCLSESSRELKAIIGRIESKNVDRSTPVAQWTARQVVIHLVHSEINYAARLRNALTDENYLVQPFKQDEWVTKESETPVNEALLLLNGLRSLNLSLIRSTSDEDKSRVFMHPEFGEMSIGTLIEIMAGHDLSHFKQLERIADSLSG